MPIAKVKGVKRVDIALGREAFPIHEAVELEEVVRCDLPSQSAVSRYTGRRSRWGEGGTKSVELHPAEIAVQIVGQGLGQPTVGDQLQPAAAALGDVVALAQEDPAAQVAQHLG